MSRKYRKSAEMLAMCERFKSSDLSIQAFSAKEGISKGTFQYWRLKFLKEEAQEITKAPRSFHAITSPKLPSTDAVVKIRLAEHLSIELPSSYSIAQIANLVNSISQC